MTNDKSARRRLALEPLEDRKLLALLGIAGQLGFPVIAYDSTGTLAYDGSVDRLDLDATPLAFRQSAASPIRPVTGTPDFTIRIQVDNSGNLIGGVAGDDFILTGQIDIDGDSIADFTGTLLTGEVTQFGFADIGVTDSYDFRFTPTAGALVGLWAGKDIGVTTSSENSTFVGTFAETFNGGAKGNIGAIPALFSSLAGHVYYDANNNGLFDTGLGEPGIPAAAVTLTGIDDLGNAVLAATATDAAGAYSFTNLRPGTYQLTETQPIGFLDGIDTIGTPGGTTANDVFAGILLPPGFDGLDNNFGELVPASLAGCVYLDVNNNGVKEAAEGGVFGVTILLTGADDLEGAVNLSTTTDASGRYSFDNLRPGVYRINEVHPVVFLDGIDTLGTLGGTMTNDQFAGIVLSPAAAGVDYCFGERGLEPTLISKEQLLASTPPTLARWVDSLYQGILGRSGSLNEILGWLDAIQAGASFHQVAAAFLHSVERRSSIIDDLYQQYLGRSADAEGLAHWIRVWDNAGLQRVQASIIASAEFYQSAGGTDADWLAALYQRLLTRSASSAEIAFWSATLAGTSREEVVIGIVTSDEYRGDQIRAWYAVYLGRPVDAAGLAHWLAQLRLGQSHEFIQAHLLASLESRLRWA